MRKHRLYAGVIVVLLQCCGVRGFAQEIAVAGQLAATAMSLSADSGDVRPAKWTYEQGVVWLAMMRLWYSTGDDARYYNYVKRQVDRLVDKDGNIATYNREDFSLDNILGGRVLLELYEVTLDARYYKAALRLREQLRDQPRTAEGKIGRAHV